MSESEATSQSPSKLQKGFFGTEDICAYAKLEGSGIVYYIQDVNISLGRKYPDNKYVDVPLEDSDSIAHKHAHIFYNRETAHFEFAVYSTTCAYVDEKLVTMGTNASLKNGSKIQIGNVSLWFSLPDRLSDTQEVAYASQIIENDGESEVKGLKVTKIFSTVNDDFCDTSDLSEMEDMDTDKEEEATLNPPKEAISKSNEPTQDMEGQEDKDATQNAQQKSVAYDAKTAREAQAEIRPEDKLMTDLSHLTEEEKLEVAPFKLVETYRNDKKKPPFPHFLLVVYIFLSTKSNKITRDDLCNYLSKNFLYFRQMSPLTLRRSTHHVTQCKSFIFKLTKTAGVSTLTLEPDKDLDRKFRDMVFDSIIKNAGAKVWEAKVNEIWPKKEEEQEEEEQAEKSKESSDGELGPYETMSMYLESENPPPFDIHTLITYILHKESSNIDKSVGLTIDEVTKLVIDYFPSFESEYKHPRASVYRCLNRRRFISVTDRPRRYILAAEAVFISTFTEEVKRAIKRKPGAIKWKRRRFTSNTTENQNKKPKIGQHAILSISSAISASQRTSNPLSKIEGVIPNDLNDLFELTTRKNKAEVTSRLMSHLKNRLLVYLFNPYRYPITQVFLDCIPEALEYLPSDYISATLGEFEEVRTMGLVDIPSDLITFFQKEVNKRSPKDSSVEGA